MKLTYISAVAFALAANIAEAKLSDKIHGRIHHFADSIMDTVDKFVGKADEIQEKADKIASEVDKYVSDNQDHIQNLVDVLNNLPEDIKNVRDNADIAVDYFDHQADLHDMDFLPLKNSTCITMHCSGYIAICLAEEDCRENLRCNSDCPIDNGTLCEAACDEIYKSSRLDKLMQCLNVDNECLSIPTLDSTNDAPLDSTDDAPLDPNNEAIFEQ